MFVDEECQGETHEMLCTGAQGVALKKGYGQQLASEPLAWFDTHSPCTGVGSLVFSDQLTSVLKIWALETAWWVLWIAGVKWSWMPSLYLFKQQNSSQAGIHVHPCPGALGMLRGDQDTLLKQGPAVSCVCKQVLVHLGLWQQWFCSNPPWTKPLWGVRDLPHLSLWVSPCWLRYVQN